MKQVLIHELNDELEKLPINYANYLNWLDEEDSSEYFGISLPLLRTEPKNYSLDQKKDLLKKVDKKIIRQILDILETHFPSKYLVKHEYKEFDWFPDSLFSDAFCLEMKGYFIDNGKISNIEKFRGAMIENNIAAFINLFYSYSFLFGYANIDLFSCEYKLLIKITHHCTIDIITDDRKIYDFLKRDLNSRFVNYNEYRES